MTQRSPWIQWGMAGLLMALIVVARTMDHAPNCTPVLGVALFAGFFLQQRKATLGVVLGGMAVTDTMVGWYPLEMMIAVYASLLLPLAFRPLLSRSYSPERVGLSALASSLFFFATTNFAHWLFMGWFPYTVGGIVECYAAALPFLMNQLMGDAMWTTILFGGYALAMHLANSIRTRAAIA